LGGWYQALEIGTFRGYSALAIAAGLPEDGKLVACAASAEWTNAARLYWCEAGLASRIDLRLGPALETLRSLPATTRFDFAFIDADKTNYRNYYEEVLKRMRAGGLILIDNVLWNGAVIDPKIQTDDTRAIRTLNDFLATDDRIDMVMLPVSDGLTICRKG